MVTNAERIKLFQEESRKRREAKKQNESGVIIEPVKLDTPAVEPVKPAKFDTVTGSAPQKGVFVNTATGQKVDKFGAPLGQSQPAGFVAPQRTTAQRGRSLFEEEEYVQPLNFAKELGLDVGDAPTSLEDQLRMLTEEQARVRQQAEEKVRLQNLVEAEDVRSAKRAGEGAVAATKSSLLTGREGPTSASNVMAADIFEKETNRRFEVLSAQAQGARVARDNALRDLKRAQQKGNLDLAKSAQQRLDVAEQEIIKADTELLNASTAASQEARAVQQAARQNLETFVGLVETGATLTPEGIKGFASQLDIPFEDAFDFYQGSQSIRQDKQLSTQEKAIGLEDLKVDLARKKAGRDDLKLRQVDQLSQMYKSGASAEEISSYKELVGITDKDDPVYKLDLRIKAAEAQMKEAEANGQIISPQDKLSYAQDLLEYKEQLGELGAYVPTKSKYKVSASDDGIRINVKDGQYIDKIGTKRDEGQCGAFVNDVLGIGIGDSFENKMSFVDPSVIVPTPGMAFVQKTNTKYGHTGIVESVNADGTFNIVEANYGNPGTIGRRTLSVNDVAGFVRPKNAEFVGGEKAFKSVDQLSAVDISQANRALAKGDFEGARLKAIAESVAQAKRDSNTPIQDVLRLTLGGKTPTQSQEEKISSIQAVIGQLDDLEQAVEKKGKFSTVRGILESGNPLSTQRAEVKAHITGLLPRVARGVYGEVGVLTDADIKRYESLLPTLTNTQKQKSVLLDILRTSLKRGAEESLRGFAAAGVDVSGYEGLLGRLGVQSSQEGKQVNPFDAIDLDTPEEILGQFDL